MYKRGLPTPKGGEEEERVWKTEQESLANADKRATAVCVWRLVFAISPVFDAP